MILEKMNFRKNLTLLAILGCFVACTAQTNTEEKTYAVNKTEAQWKKELSPEQYYVLREKGTERPGTGLYNHHKETGVYTCAGCSHELFSSENKYNSGSGWPSFDQAINEGHVEEHSDYSHGMVRTEILCANCGGHLGHVFNDGPKETTGQRYCVNSLSLSFKKTEK